MDLKIIYEDRHLLVLDKPAGLMVEKDRYGNPNLVQVVEDYLLQKERTQNLIVANVHRLDRPVSGVIVIAKRKSVLRNISEQFAGREVGKTYLAVTDKNPEKEEGTLVHWLEKDKLNKKALIFEGDHKNTDRVELKYKVLAEREGNFLWEINLITGKYHQIRAQLAFIGCPIIGDVKYGSTVLYQPDTIALHSWKLTLKYPEEKTILFVADLPEDTPWSLFKVDS